MFLFTSIVPIHPIYVFYLYVTAARVKYWLWCMVCGEEQYCRQIKFISLNFLKTRLEKEKKEWINLQGTVHIF